jgi:type II secretory pathway component PulF
LTLDDVLSFNEELLTLAKTGLPIELAVGDDYAALSRKLSHANAKLALEVGRGRPLEDALAEAVELTPQYRSALKTWVRCDRSPEALEGLTGVAQGRRRIQADVAYALLQPLVLLVLVYCGFTYMVLVNAPRLEGMYTQFWHPPGPGLRVLLAARQTQPVWGIAVPVLIILGLVWWKLGADRWDFRWLPWRTKTLAALRKANYAESVASLLERQHSLGQALAVLGPPPSDDTSGREAYAAATQRLIEAERHSEPLAVHDPALQPLPPLLRWAFTSGLTGTALANVLRFAARNYLETARRKLSFWRVWFPIILGSLIGGSLVLLYGLSLFLPMVELLRTLTQP